MCTTAWCAGGCPGPGCPGTGCRRSYSRRSLGAQECLLDLLRTRCTSLVRMAERLLRHSRKRQQARERHLQDLLVVAGFEAVPSSDATTGIEVARLNPGP